MTIWSKREENKQGAESVDRPSCYSNDKYVRRIEPLYPDQLEAPSGRGSTALKGAVIIYKVPLALYLTLLHHPELRQCRLAFGRYFQEES